MKKILWLCLLLVLPMISSSLELRPQLGHTNSVLALAYSPDGLYVASAGADRSIKLWELKSGKEIRSFTGHTGTIRGLAFSPKGKTIASTGDDLSVRLWDVSSETLLWSESRHPEGAYSVAFSPDGKTIASSGGGFFCKDCSVRLWDADSGKERAMLKGHTSLIFSVSFSPDGKFLVTASAGGELTDQPNMVPQTIKLWDVTSGKEIRSFFGHADSVYSAVFSPDGKWIASSGHDKTVKLWEVSSGKEVRAFTGHTDRVFRVQFSPNGERLATASADKTAKIWDVSSGKALASFEGHSGSVNCIAFSPDGKSLVSAGFGDRFLRLWDQSGQELKALSINNSRISNAAVFNPKGQLAVSGRDKTIGFWDLTTGKLVRSFLVEEDLNVVFSPDGKLISSPSDGNSFSVWEASTGEKLRSFVGHTKRITAVAFSPDGKTIASASWDQSVKLWDVATGKELKKLALHSIIVEAVAFSPDGQYLLTQVLAGAPHVWELKSGKMVSTLEWLDQSISEIAFGSAGKYFATVASSLTTDNSVRLWRAGDFLARRIFVDHTNVINHGVVDYIDEINHVAVSPNGKLIAGANNFVKRRSSGSFVKLWSDSGELLQTLEGHTDLVFEVAFSPNGKTLASSSRDGSVILWNTSKGKMLRSFFVNKGNSINTVAFSRDGSFIAIGGSDGWIRFWEVTTGKELRVLKGHTDTINTLAFSPNGETLVSGDYNAAIKLWDVATGKELRTFTGHSKAISAVAFSPDGKTLASASRDRSVKLWDATTGKELRTFTKTYAFSSVTFHPDGSTLLASSEDKIIYAWDLASGREINSLAGHTNSVESVVYSPNGKMIYSGSEDGTVIAWPATGATYQSLEGHKDRVLAVAFSPDEKYVASASRDQTIKLWESATGKEIRTFKGHSSAVTSISFSRDGSLLSSASKDGTVRLWRVDGSASVSLASSTDGDWLLCTDDGYFDSSPGGVSLIAAVEGMNAYNIDQLALKNNRPDLILSRMGLGSPALIEYYKKRYLQRLKKNKIEDESKLDGAFQNLPQSTIVDTKVTAQSAKLSINLEDKTGLTFYQVYINGVPLYEGPGKETSGTSQTLTEEISLTQGDNRVEVSVLNERGQESFRALSLLKGPDKPSRDLYFVGFGVSDYKDPDIPDLEFAHKDATELSGSFEELKGYDNKISKVFTNEQVTKESIQEARELLKKARPQDTVVLFIAGHGLYDRDDLATYYYIISETQIEVAKDGAVKIDASTAVSFEEIEGLLSGIEAKQKLFLMDTCESGERDEVVAASAIVGAESQALGARAIGVSKLKAAPKKTKRPVKSSARPWLLERDRYIYQDLAKRTGAVVFSSSKGGEYSFESKKLENGLFTEALMEAFSGSADADKSGDISLQELQQYTNKKVITLSKDLQHPTIDRNNPYLKLSFSTR